MRSLRPRALAVQGRGRIAAAVLIAAALALGGLWPRPGRAVELLVLMALLAAAGWSGWRVAQMLVPRALASRLVCAFTAAVAALTGSATLLGHFGHLRLGPFLAVMAVWFAGCLVLPPAGAGAGGGDAGTAAATSGRLPLARFERALLLAAAAALALRFGGSLVHVARDPGAFVGYDDLSYHLPAVAVWQHSGDLRMVKFETGDPSPTFYPFTTELCSWALLAPLGDSDVAARRVQLPFALASLIAVAAIARRLGASRRAALLAVLLYATVDRAFPVLALGAGNDHATCFFTLASLDGGLALALRPGRRSAAYAGTALGLLVGTKYIGLFFAATVLAALGALWLMRRAGGARGGRALMRDAGAVEDGGARGALEDGAAEGALEEGAAGGALEAGCAGRAGAMTGAWGALSVLGTLGAAMLLCGGYAYARNAWTAGNPIFPAPIGLWGHSVLPGWRGASLEWRRHLPEFRIATFSFLTGRADLFGPLFAWTMLPAALIAPALALARRCGRVAVVLALPLAFFLEFRFLMHDHRDVRYILPALAIAAVAAAWLLASVERRLGAALRCAVLVGILLAAASHLRLDALEQAALATLLCLAGGLAAAAADRLAARRKAPGTRSLRLAVGTLGVATALAAAWAGAPWVERFQAAKLAADPAAAALDAVTGNGARVAYVGSNEPYLFFGSRLQNDLQIVPTDGDLAAQWYAWGGSTHFPFDRASIDWWRQNLAVRHVDLVVAARSRDEGPERSWMAASPRDFTLLYQTAQVEIWRVGKGRAGPSYR